MNSGKQFLVEMASREFCEQLQKLAQDDSINLLVKSMAKELFQKWSLLLKAVDPTNLSFMHEALLECKRAGVQFPPIVKQPDPSLVDTNGPPDWTDSPICTRCRVEFSFSCRQHHCRRCGKSFCNACSSRELPLSEYGLPEPVRVCEPCYVDRTNGQIKREPSQVVLPGEKRIHSPVDLEVEEAIKLSLMEDKLRQARLASSSAEEESQIASAIAASLKDTKTGSNSKIIEKKKEKELITLNERETLTLFRKLVKQMLEISRAPGTKASDIEVEEDMRGTGDDLKKLKDRLSKSIEKGKGDEEVLRVLDDIDDALYDFESLQIEHENLRIKEKYPNTCHINTVADKEEGRIESAPIQFPPLPNIKDKDEFSKERTKRMGEKMVLE